MQRSNDVVVRHEPGAPSALELTKLPPGVWSVWEASKTSTASEGQTWLRFSWSPTPSRGPSASSTSHPES